MNSVRETALDELGSDIREWCERAGVSRSFVYKLPPERRPAMVRLSPRLILVTEDPRDWVNRIAEEVTP